jgi:hypothetical protein
MGKNNKKELKMTPLYIEEKVYNMTAEALKEKLEYYSYNFCVLSDHSDPEAEEKLIRSLEKYFIETLIRLIKHELGYVPKQNKMFERVEEVFSNQDAYNINRSLSSIRRAKMFGIDPEDEKYIKWFENRVFYAIKTLKTKLDKLIVEEKESEVESYV